MGDRTIWRFHKRPTGPNLNSVFELADEEIPALSQAEILIANQYIGMDAGTRNWLKAREDGFAPPLPLGAAMVGILIGTVEASEHPDYKPGQLVRAWGQWSNYSIVNPEEVTVHVLDQDIDDIRHYLGLLGPTGLTAYFGVTDIGRAKEGETFVVSAAAGATGSVAGQIARIIGCKTIGIAGTQEKLDWIVSDLGFDLGINYKTDNVEDQLRDACPEGIDVYFDNVAGPILDAVLANIAIHGRIALCGMMDNYNKDELVPGPYKFDMLLMRRATITGFLSRDFFSRMEESDTQIREWMDQGRITLRFDETEGIENALTTYQRLFRGRNIGKLIIKV
ncbi:MAG: NADP-dependent oxidoreductase [Actinomycetota bacterium]|nr:NADP-dependent oxidoreductase [Actinomycetota bacterium]